MLWYIRCPSCSRVISKRLNEYFSDLDSIRNDPKMDKSEKEEKAAKLLDKYGFKTICCRSRIMGLLQFHLYVLT